MPNCFSLTRKGETAPAILQRVDDEMRQHFAQPPDPDNWLANWYHVIGFLIACKAGCDLGSAKLRDEVNKWYLGDGVYSTLPDAERLEYCDNMIQILDWLEANYTSNNWVQIGRI